MKGRFFILLRLKEFDDLCKQATNQIRKRSNSVASLKTEYKVTTITVTDTIKITAWVSTNRIWGLFPCKIPSGKKNFAWKFSIFQQISYIPTIFNFCANPLSASPSVEIRRDISYVRAAWILFSNFIHFTVNCKEVYLQ